MRILLVCALAVFSMLTKAYVIPDECILKDQDTVNELQAMLKSDKCSGIDTKNTIATETNAKVYLTSSSLLELPYAFTFVFEQGAQWHIGESTQIELLGKIETPNNIRNRLFFGDGNVIRPRAPLLEMNACPISSLVAYPEWFGAVVDDGIDDSDAISKALLLGERVELAEGNYHLKSRLVLDRNQSLIGMGMSLSRLTQMANANILQFDDKEMFQIQDFIVGLASDCATVKDLSILGNLLPDDLDPLSDLRENIGIDPLVSGIQISSHMNWKPRTPPIKAIVVKNVEIYYPASSCINMQSDRAAHDVLIEGVICNARNSRINTSGLTIEGFHYDDEHANKFYDIRVKNSTFNGGTWGLYIAGASKFLFENSTVNTDAILESQQVHGSINAALFYTGDVGHSITATIKNSSFNLMKPSINTRAVIELAGRGYAKDLEQALPYLIEKESSIQFENTSLTSAEYPYTKLIPLVLDNTGFKKQVEFLFTSFIGGSNAIFAGDPEPTEPVKNFGATVYIASSGATEIRDLNAQEIESHRMHHSKFFISQSQFYRQAGSSIKQNYGALSVFDTTFYDIGLSPELIDEPIIDLGIPTEFGQWVSGYNIQNNGYSGVYATAFLRLPGVALTQNTLWNANSSFATSQSRPADKMESIRCYPKIGMCRQDGYY